MATTPRADAGVVKTAVRTVGGGSMDVGAPAQAVLSLGSELSPESQQKQRSNRTSMVQVDAAHAAPLEYRCRPK